MDKSFIDIQALDASCHPALAVSGAIRREPTGISKSGMIDFEIRTRNLYSAGLAAMVANRLLDQIADNIGIGFLSIPIFMALAVLLLVVRFVAVALQCEIKRVLVSAILLILSFVSWMNSEQSYLFVAALLLLGIGGIDIKRLVRQYSVVILALIALLGLLQVLQLALYGTAPGSALRSDGRVRLSFFFQHPNMLAAYMSMAYIGITAGMKKFRGGTAVFGVILAIVCVFITDSRTATAILLLYLALRLLMHFRPTKGVIATFIYASTPVLLAGFAIAAAMSTMPDALYGLLQNLLNGRPGFWQLQYELLGGFTLFGQQALSGTVVVDGWVHYGVTIDSFYAGAPLSLGLWALFAFYILYLRAGKEACKKGDYGIAIALFCCSLYGFTEIHMVDLSVVLPMLFLGSSLLASQGSMLTMAGVASMIETNNRVR